MQIRENLDRCGSGTKEARERVYACVCARGVGFNRETRNFRNESFCNLRSTFLDFTNTEVQKLLTSNKSFFFTGAAIQKKEA